MAAGRLRYRRPRSRVRAMWVSPVRGRVTLPVMAPRLIGVPVGVLMGRELIADTAKNLRTQGAEIHKMAAGTSINIDTLKAAFVDIKAAMDDVAKFRQEALPQMAAAIVELDKLSAEATKSIVNMENAKRVSETLNKELN